MMLTHANANRRDDDDDDLPANSLQQLQSARKHTRLYEICISPRCCCTYASSSANTARCRLPVSSVTMKHFSLDKAGSFFVIIIKVAEYYVVRTYVVVTGYIYAPPRIYVIIYV